MYKSHTHTQKSVHMYGQLTIVSTAALSTHVQRKHINRDHLQLIIDLQDDIKQIDTH